MARYIDAEQFRGKHEVAEINGKLYYAIPYADIVYAPTADVVPKSEVLRLQSFKELIKSRGLTQAELATMVGCSQRAITHWISGRNLPTLKEAYLLAYVLGITLDELAIIFLYGERETTDGMSAPKEK